MRRQDFLPDVWAEAKREARKAIIKRAKKKKVLTYQDLAREISSISFDFEDVSHRVTMGWLLDIISRDSYRKREGVISSIVIRKGSVGNPGEGFYKLMGNLGYDTSDKTACWSNAMNEVFNIWG